MSSQARKSFIVRLVLILALIGGISNTDQVLAAPQTQQDTPACIPGSGWQWAYGPSRPDLAQQAELALRNQGVEATVSANEYGEQDSCGNFELFSVDFTVTLKPNPVRRQSLTLQADLSDNIIAALTEFAEPQLGNVRIDPGSGIARTYTSSMEAQALSEKTASASSLSLSAASPVTRKAFLLVYNPILSNGQDLITYMGWMPVASMSQGIIDSFLTSSQGGLQYTIAEQVIANEWPAKVDGFRYTETSFFQVWQNPSLAHNPPEANYDLIVDQYDICGKLNRGEIDELWLIGAPHFGFYESTLVGPGGYLYNSPPLTQTHGCNKLLPIMGLSYERGLGEAVHSFGHRVEATMTKIYGGWEENRTSHNWDRFGLVKVQSPDYSYSGCGSIHFTPNSQIAYEYDHPNNVLTNCEDFRNYPNLSDPLIVAQPVNCMAWNCTHLEYLEYWFNHLPAATGCGPDTRANDWWPYFLDPNLGNYASVNCSPPPCPTITNWKAEYWNNATFTGSPVICRDDAAINFDWFGTSPDPLIVGDYFAARWTRTVNFSSGVYRFRMLNDDGGRLYVDDVLELDAWSTCCTWNQTEVALTQGNHAIRMEMFENTGWSSAKLEWQKISELATPTATATSTPPAVSLGPVYLSLTGSQTIGGVASADEDILRFDGTNWSLFFDGSDVGVGSPDLFAFSIVDPDTILMSFSANVTVNGIAATPQDVLRFDATSLGSTTSGTWSLVFDGSDVGFADTTTERIDAVSVLPDGSLLMSTTGNPVVPGVSSARDEDVLAFLPTSLGANTVGTWSMYFDGSDVGLGETSGEDIDALEVVRGNIYLSTLENFSVNGLSGADEDVFVCTAGSLGSVTTCTYSPALYFDGSAWGLSANDVDGFGFLLAGTPPTNTPTPTATASGVPSATNTNTPTQTPTSGSPGTLTFTAAADARVSQSSPTTNYGTATTLNVDAGATSALTSFMRFNASGISGPIQSAKLRVFCTTNGTANGPAAYLANSTWVESGTGGINWNTQPALLSGAFDNKGAIASNSWVEYDVTSLVTTNDTYTFALVADSSDGVVFSSREGGTPPQLVITFGGGAPTYTPTPTATQTPTTAPAMTNTPTPTFTATSTASPSSTPTTTATPSSTSELTFLPIDDAFIASGSPTSNYGSATTLQVDNSPVKHFLLKFNVSGLDGGTVTGAKLRLYNVDPSSRGGDFYPVSDHSWQEETLTWNNAPAALTTPLASLGAVNANNWYEVDVTSLITGDGTYSLRISSTSTGGADYSSKEGANPPQLLITVQ